jgi:hypothetical protein
MAKKTSIETKYTVKDEKDVKISVTFGNGQFGTSSLRVGTKSKIGELSDFSLGKGAGIKGKKATIKSIVTDVNDKTNNVSATYTLSGGAQEQEFGLESVVEEEGDSERFSVVVQFV